MWSDRESAEDFLNFTELAEQIAALSSNPRMLPVSIGVFGTWGTGKSTVLQLVRKELDAAERPPLIIEFDAWLYQGFDDAKAALMEVVADILLDAAKTNEGLTKKVKRFASRVNYFRAIGLAADFGVGMAFGVPPGLLTKAGGAISSLVSGQGNKADREALQGAGKQVAEDWSKLIKPEEARTPPKEIAAFRQEFGEILRELDRTLVLFIDNLDRCLPDVAIGTLEAIRLFLFMPGTAFVVAADEDMIRHSVARHFHDPNVQHVKDYLDKVIQVPFRVPRVGVDDVRAYMYSLFVQLTAPDRLLQAQTILLKALQNAWQGATFDADTVDEAVGRPAGLLEMLGTADRLAPILALAPNIGGNPRIVKRMLNAVLLRRSLAVSRGMNVDLATLAKLAVFERGTDAEATAALYTLVMEGGNRAAQLLIPAEDFQEGAQRPGGPIQWKPYEPFIEEWRRLEPKFSDPSALQPALFLSRDVMAPARRQGTDDVVAAAVEALLGVNSLNSPAAQRVIGGLTPDNRATAMAALVGRLREADWNDKVQGIHGALLLGDQSEDARRLLQALVDDLPKKSMHKGTLFALRNKDYVRRD